jgi:MOSC domain-containing protein YiiM
MQSRVVSVSRSGSHTFSKARASSIELVAGLGVRGDAHCGATVKHRSRVAQDPSQPNLRQVHLIHSELFVELSQKGFSVHPGDMGENITTQGVDLLALPVDTELHIGAAVVVRLTGLRNPCAQLDAFQPGLMAAVLERAPNGGLVRKAGVMGIVVAGGHVRPGDEVGVRRPSLPHRPLDRV